MKYDDKKEKGRGKKKSFVDMATKLVLARVVLDVRLRRVGIVDLAIGADVVVSEVVGCVFVLVELEQQFVCRGGNRLDDAAAARP